MSRIKTLILFSGAAWIAISYLDSASGGSLAAGPQGGVMGFGSGSGSPPTRWIQSAPTESNGYDFSGPKFQFSVRKKPVDTPSSDAPVQVPAETPGSPKHNGFWQDLGNGFGIFDSK